MTGIESVVILVMTFVFFSQGMMYASGAEDIVGTTAIDGTLITEDLAFYLGQYYMTLAFPMLGFSIWCIIVWIICFRSKTVRRRTIICTIIGRGPVVLIIVYALMSHVYSGMVYSLIFWAFLTIGLSFLGWKENEAIPHSHVV